MKNKVNVKNMLLNLLDFAASAAVMVFLISSNIDNSIYISLLAVLAVYAAFIFSDVSCLKFVAIGSMAATLSCYIYFAAGADPTGFGGAVMMAYLFIDIALVVFGYPVCRLIRNML